MTKYLSASIIQGNQDFDLPYKVNYGEFVIQNLLKTPNETAMINGKSGEQFTYGDLAQQIVNTASSFIRMGISSGDVIGICSENRPEFLITAIAGMCTEATVTLVNSAYVKDELIHTLKISKPKYMFLSSTTFEKYFKIMQDLDFIDKFYVFGSTIVYENIDSFSDLIAKHVNINSFQHMNFNGMEKTALILYSSGTTGLPKGAKLSHRNLIISGQPFTFKRDLVCLTIAPWTNTVGIILTLRKLINNLMIVYLPKYNEEDYLNSIQKYKVGVLFTVPPLVVMLKQSKQLQNYDISSVQLFFCGGAPLDPSTIVQAKLRFPNLKHVLQGYGMTETTGAVTEEHEQAPRQGSVGKIADGIILKIVDVETRKLLGPNKPGEVLVKGPVLFQGYVGKDMSEYLDNEGFYSTGDVAYYDEDGYIYIVDRIKELIKYKAWQVSPSELEAILRKHPAVKDAGVTGAPDRLAGELPTAFVVKVVGTTVTERDLVEFVGSKVSSWKQLRGGVKFVQEIPKNGSGKILRRKLREMLFIPPASKL